jgi:Arm DNA-binding domain/GYF domain 2
MRMSDTWYYAELDKPVGPISIVELKRFLHRLKDWKDRLVWHSSFNDWCKAGSVPVLRAKADLLWDDEVRGLCVRVYGDGSRSFVFLYRLSGRQRFIRIGRSPEWSLGTARIRAQKLRSIVDQGQAILTGFELSFAA